MSHPRFFSTPLSFNKWLQKNGAREDELLVGFYRVNSGKRSITWPESVDEALCFGWIDGIRKRIDDESYTIRFTPRRARSNWSARNIERVSILTKENRMQPAGLAAFAKRLEQKSVRYAYEQKNVQLGKEYEDRFRANTKAWTFFQSLPASFRQPSIWWVVSAKKEETRQRRLGKLIDCSADATVLPQFLKAYSPRKKK